MAYNRFHKPIERYVPIPFQELMTVGKELNRQREQAEAELNANIRTFGKFVSPSLADMQNYQRESIGKLAPFLEQAAANPEVMKDAAWRASMQSAINNIDYAKLGMYEQSAANLNARLQNIAKMEAAGKYNPNWDRLNISAWNSDVQGVMNDLTPIEYQSLESFGASYVDKLQPTFYKGADPNSGVTMPYTNWMSITRDDIARQFAQHINDIKNNPQGREHYNDIAIDVLAANPNATQADIDDAFIDALTTRQLDKIVSKPVVDQVGLQYARWAHDDEVQARKLAADLAKAKAKGGSSEEQNIPYITPRKQLSAQFISNLNDYVSRNITDPKRSDYRDLQLSILKNRNEADYWHAAAEAAKQSGASLDEVNEYTLMSQRYAAEELKEQTTLSRKEFANMYGDNKISAKDFDKFKKKIDWNKFNKTSQDLIDNMGGQITLTDSHDMLKHTATPTKVVWSGGESEGFSLNSSADVVLPFELGAAITALNGKLPMDDNVFVQAFKTGAYKNIKIVPQARGTVLADPTSTNTKKREYIKATAVVDLNNVDLDRYHYGASLLETITPIAAFEQVGEWFQGGYDEQAIKALGGKYNPDTNTAEIEVYVPLGETAQQAELYNFERNKERFGTTTNTEDRYDYTYQTNQQRLNTGYYGEEE